MYIIKNLHGDLSFFALNFKMSLLVEFHSCFPVLLDPTVLFPIVLCSAQVGKDSVSYQNG